MAPALAMGPPADLHNIDFVPIGRQIFMWLIQGGSAEPYTLIYVMQDWTASHKWGMVLFLKVGYGVTRAIGLNPCKARALASADLASAT